MNTWVFGDVHGAYKALVQIFERTPSEHNDTIISLGDICDGWSETYECVNFLIEKSKEYNMIFIRGNHDDWFYKYLTTGVHGSNWTQGAKETFLSYKHNNPIIEEPNYMNNTGLNIENSHIEFFKNQKDYYILDRKLYVHGGFNRHELINEQHWKGIHYWDRDLWNSALSFKAMNKGLMMKDHDIKFKYKDKSFDEVFIGHTTTMMWDKMVPMNAANIWNLDTGAGFKGKLTIMNVNTKEYYQSDYLPDLYPCEFGRNK